MKIIIIIMKHDFREDDFRDFMFREANFLCDAETEGCSAELVHRRQTDRPRCQQNLQGPLDVQETIRCQVSFSIGLYRKKKIENL